MTGINDLISRLRDPSAIRADAWTVCDEAAEALILLRDALQRIANARAWGAPGRWEQTPFEVRQLAREALALTPTKIKKAEVK